MSLRRKRHSFRPGFPECTGILVLSGALFAGVLWGIELAKSGWIETAANVVGVSLPEAGSLGGGSIGFAYEYEVKGQTYTGQWEGNAVSSPLAKAALPPGTLERLREAGVISFDGTGLDSVSLTPEARRKMREQGYTEAGLREQALNGELPPDAAGLGIEASLSGEVGAVALGGGPGDPMVSGDAGTGSRLREVYVDLGAQAAVKVRYDPQNPSLSVLSYPGFALRLPYLIGFALTTGLTLGYFTLVYPRLKEWGY